MELYSNCCTALPVNELNVEEGYITLGYCSKCKRGARFLKEKEIMKWDTEYQKKEKQGKIEEDLKVNMDHKQNTQT